MIEIIFIFLIIVLVDFGWTGYLPVMLQVSYSLKEIEKSDVIYCGLVGIVACPRRYRTLNFRVKYASGIRLILTKDYLYIQDTMRSYAVKFSIKDFNTVELVKNSFSKKITGGQIVILMKNGEELKFTSADDGKWLAVLVSEVSNS